MKAIISVHPATLDSLTLVDRAEPEPPGPGEITVRLHASSLNFHDYAVVVGLIPTVDGLIPLSDGAGEVIAVGDAVDDFRRGDAVVSTFFPNWLDGAKPNDAFSQVPGDGVDGYARKAVTTAARAFTRAPNGYTHAEAATLTCAGVTAWRALVVDGAITPGATVLVQGTGGVSIFALQFAKAMGCTVIATSSSESKLEQLQQLGADLLINYRQDPQWGARALKLTGGGGVDHVVEIGGPATLDQSMIATRPGGHIAMVGALTGLTGAISTATILGKQLRVQGLTVGSSWHQRDLIRAIEGWRLKPVIDSRFPLEQLAEAFRRQESGLHFGKIVIEI